MDEGDSSLAAEIAAARDNEEVRGKKYRATTAVKMLASPSQLADRASKIAYTVESHAAEASRNRTQQFEVDGAQGGCSRQRRVVQVGSSADGERGGSDTGHPVLPVAKISRPPSPVLLKIKASSGFPSFLAQQRGRVPHDGDSTIVHGSQVPSWNDY